MEKAQDEDLVSIFLSSSLSHFPFHDEERENLSLGKIYRSGGDPSNDPIMEFIKR